ncbi:MAG: type II secretion system F family protein [Candidatus Aenigmarchaeota archaeon]|nr:type II secretion system F family protein [Candidatus Aenigmarchaeota archaeon]
MITYSAVATVLFGDIVDKHGHRVKFLRDSLIRAGVKFPFRSYGSVVLLNSLIAYVFSLGVFSFATMYLKLTLIQNLFLILYAPFMVAGIALGVLVLYPYQKMISIRKSINTNLPFALTHMAAISESGAPPYMIFKLISNFDEYGEIAKEMKVLVRNIDTFGVDPLTAIRELAERTPSNELRQILLGILSTTESGGDVRTYIKNAGEQALFSWKLNREKFMQQLSAYAEFYTGILIAAPLFIVSLFAVMNMIQPNIGGFDILVLTKLSLYVLVPFLNVGFLLFLKGVEVEM